MWVIFRYVKTEFQNLDKYIYDVVEDEDIMVFQDYLGDGKKSDLNQNVYFIQEFFEASNGVRFYARKYEPFTTLRTRTTCQAEQPVLDTPKAAKTHALVRRNPCSIGQ